MMKNNEIGLLRSSYYLLISFLKIQFFTFDKIKIHTTVSKIATIAFTIEEIVSFNSPKPMISSGPSTTTTIAPPPRINNHITKMKK